MLPERPITVWACPPVSTFYYPSLTRLTVYRDLMSTVVVCRRRLLQTLSTVVVPSLLIAALHVLDAYTLIVVLHIHLSTSSSILPCSRCSTSFARCITLVLPPIDLACRLPPPYTSWPSSYSVSCKPSLPSTISMITITISAGCVSFRRGNI